MCMYMCVYIYIYTHIHIIYIYIYIYVCTYISPSTAVSVALRYLACFGVCLLLLASCLLFPHYVHVLFRCYNLPPLIIPPYKQKAPWGKNKLFTINLDGGTITPLINDDFGFDLPPS